MTTTVEPGAVAGPPGPVARLADRLVGAIMRLPAGTGYTVTRGQRVPMRDGVELVADLYRPASPGLGTILVRGPYGPRTSTVPFPGASVGA